VGGSGRTVEGATVVDAVVDWVEEKVVEKLVVSDEEVDSIEDELSELVELVISDVEDVDSDVEVEMSEEDEMAEVVLRSPEVSMVGGRVMGCTKGPTGIPVILQSLEF